MKADRVRLWGILLLVSFIVMGCTNDANKETRNEPSPVAAQKYVTKSTGGVDQGNVLVEATPKGMADGRFVIEVLMNTHSVDLEGIDLKNSAVLSVGGKAFSPADAPKLSGHHGAATLAFDVGEEPASFGLSITGIPSIEKREYYWE